MNFLDREVLSGLTLLRGFLRGVPLPLPNGTPQALFSTDWMRK